MPSNMFAIAFYIIIFVGANSSEYYTEGDYESTDVGDYMYDDIGTTDGDYMYETGSECETVGGPDLQYLRATNHANKFVSLDDEQISCDIVEAQGLIRVVKGRRSVVENCRYVAGLFKLISTPDGEMEFELLEALEAYDMFISHHGNWANTDLWICVASSFEKAIHPWRVERNEEINNRCDVLLNTQPGRALDIHISEEFEFVVGDTEKMQNHFIVPFYRYTYNLNSRTDGEYAFLDITDVYTRSGIRWVSESGPKTKQEPYACASRH